jgi:hypothetical protein
MDFFGFGHDECEVSLLGTKRYSLLKNSFALSSASEPGAENDVFIVFWPCFGPLLDQRPGTQRLFQQAG